MTQVQQFDMGTVSKVVRKAISEYNADRKRNGISDAIVCSVRINRQWESLKSDPRSVMYIEGLSKREEDSKYLWNLVDSVCESYGLRMVGEHGVYNIKYTLIKDL